MTPYHRTHDRTAERVKDEPGYNRPPEHIIRCRMLEVRLLLGDKPLDARVGVSRSRTPSRLSKPVIDSNGTRYASATKAGEAMGHTADYMARACRRGYAVRGMTFKYEEVAK